MTSERGIVYRTKRTETHRARKHTGSSEPGVPGKHTVHVIVMKTSYLLKWTDICLKYIIIIHSFYIALFSALEPHWHVILNE